MRQVHRRRLAWIALLVGAFLVRFGAATWWQSRLATPLAMADSYSYWELGRTIAQGQPYRFGPWGDRVFRAPAYPLLLTPIHWLELDQSRSIRLARVLGACLGTISVALTAFLAGRIASGAEPDISSDLGRRSRWIAGLVVGVYPGAVMTSILVLSEAPFCVALLLQLLCWLEARRSDNPRRSRFLYLLTGALGGAATLIRPSWLLWTPLAAMLFPVLDRQAPRRLSGSLLILAGMILVMMPWWIRNYRVTGLPVPTTLQVGASLYDGLNPRATGASDMRFVDEFRRQQEVEDRRAMAENRSLPGTYESRVDDRLRRAAIDWSRRHPAAVARLAAVKLLRTWNPWPNADGFRRWPIRVLWASFYVPVVVAAIIGLRRLRHQGWPIWLCASSALYLTLLHVIFVGSIRYRQPAMPPLIAIAAVVAAQWTRRPSETT